MQHVACDNMSLVYLVCVRGGGGCKYYLHCKIPLQYRWKLLKERDRFQSGVVSLEIIMVFSVKLMRLVPFYSWSAHTADIV